MNNPILLSLVIYQLVIAGYYFSKGGFLLGVLFCVYAVANVVVMFLKIQ